MVGCIRSRRLPKKNCFAGVVGLLAHHWIYCGYPSHFGLADLAVEALVVALQDSRWNVSRIRLQLDSDKISPLQSCLGTEVYAQMLISPHQAAEMTCEVRQLKRISIAGKFH